MGRYFFIVLLLSLITGAPELYANNDSAATGERIEVSFQQDDDQKASTDSERISEQIPDNSTRLYAIILFIAVPFILGIDLST